MVRALASQMKTTLAAIVEFDTEIEVLCAVSPDFALRKSLREPARTTPRG
jgi:hypothetical protein